MKRLLWAIAILIIPPFVFWGAGSAMRSKQNGPSYAGTIFGRKVSFEEYSAAWQAAKNQALLMYGAKLNQVYEALNLEQQAWDRLILLEEAKKKHIRVSDREVVDVIQSFPFLQSNGQFDKRAYNMVLAEVFRITPRQFEEEIRDMLKILKLRDTAIRGIKITNKEVWEAYKKENEKSKISYILVSPSSFIKTVTLDSEAAKKYYEANTESFRVPEQVNIEYLGFEFADYQKDREKTLIAAEKIDYVLSDNTKVFEDVAKENSIPVKETGLFSRQGPIPQIGWFPEVQKIAFGLKPGERSNLIKSDMESISGYYIIKLKDKKPSYVPALDKVRDKIETILKEDAAASLAYKEANRLHKKMTDSMTAKGMKFQEAARKIRHTAQDSEFFTRNEYIQNLGPAQEIGEAAFNTNFGTLSPVIRTRAGFCMLTVVQIQPADELKFKRERKKFSQKTLEEKKLGALNEWYLGILKKAKLKSNIPAEGE